MKIILSRKGLDSSFEKAKPSPILPCGRLLSLPIPVTRKQMQKDEDGILYADLRFYGQSIREIINPLHNNKFPYEKAHLDPDLDRDRLECRKQDWKRTFGQQGKAQAYLENREVGEGDLFLFFGWFRRTRYENGQLQYVLPKKGGKDLHVIFGWLQVGEIRDVHKNQDQDEFPNWLHYHPHIVNRDRRGYTNNTIYIAADHLMLDGLPVRGAGTFPRFKPSLQLTAPEEDSKSHWCLPKWLCNEYIEGDWQCPKDHLPFDSGGRGQEFVFNMPDSPEAIEWIKTLFKNCP